MSQLKPVIEIKTCMVFNLVFVKNTILSSFFFFFLIIDLYFLNHAVIGQFFNNITELVIPIRIPSKEEKAEAEMHPVTTEAKIQKYSI